MVSAKEFAASVKAKYPQYAGVDDEVLARKIVEKYPAYASKVTFDEAPAPAPAPAKRSLLSRLFGAGPEKAVAAPTTFVRSASDPEFKSTGVPASPRPTEPRPEPAPQPSWPQMTPEARAPREDRTKLLQPTPRAPQGPLPGADVTAVPAGYRPPPPPEDNPEARERYIKRAQEREFKYVQQWARDRIRAGEWPKGQIPWADLHREWRESIGDPLPGAPVAEDPEMFDTIEEAVASDAAKREARPDVAAERLGKAYQEENKKREAAWDALWKEHSEALMKTGFSQTRGGLEKYLKSKGIEAPPLPYKSPEQFAEEQAGVPRGETAIGRGMASAADVWADVSEKTGWQAVANLLTVKSGSGRAGARILQTTAALEDAAEVRRLKAKQEAGEPLSPDEQRALDNNRFFAQLGQAAEAVRENPGEVAEALFVDLIENAPPYLLTNLATAGAAGSIASGVKSAAAAKRLAAAIKRGQSAGAAEVRAQRTAALAEKVVKPSALKKIGIEVAADTPADVAVGMVLEKGRGSDYTAADMIVDLGASGIINIPVGAVRALKSGKPLTASEFKQISDAFDVSGLVDEPAAVDILDRLKTLAADEVLVGEGLGVRATGRARFASPEEARAAGYGEDVAAGPESGRQILGDTRGQEITLRKDADRATLEEEIATARWNVLERRAAATPDGPEAALLGRIRDWAAAVREENAARPLEARINLPDGTTPGAKAAADIELFTKAYAHDVTGVEPLPGMSLVDIPDDIYNDFGRIMGTGVRPTGGEGRMMPDGALTGVRRPSPAPEPESPPLAPQATAPVAAAEAAPQAPSAAEPPTGPTRPRPSVMETVGTLPPEAAAAVRRPLPTEPPEAVEGLTPRGKTQAELDADAAAEAALQAEVRRDVGRLKRRPLPRYQLAGEAGAGRAEIAAARKAWAEKGVESPYFKKWFGDSKAVDDEGKPLVVYHGTDKDFDAFEPRTRKGEQMAFGTHFSEDPEIANRYADPEQQSRSKKVSGQNVVPSYITAKNPLYADAVVSEGSPEFDLAKKLLGNRLFSVKNEDGVPSVWLQNALDAVDPKKAEKAIREAGYDAVRYNAKITGRGLNAGNVAAQGRSWIVFSPTQIKSATGNRGTFAPTDPRINYQLRGPRKTGAAAEISRIGAIRAARVLEVAKVADARKELESLGFTPKETDEAIRRAQRIVRNARQSGSFDNAVASEILRDVTKSPSQKIKSFIEATTKGGITGRVSLTERTALGMLIKRLDLQGQVAQAKAETAAARRRAAEAMREGRKIRRELAAAVRSGTPRETHREMLAAIANANTAKDMAAGLQRIDDILAREQLQGVLNSVRSILRETDSERMLPQFRDEFQDAAAAYAARPPSQKQASFKKWYDAQPDEVKASVPRHVVAMLEGTDKAPVPTSARNIRAAARKEWEAMENPDVTVDEFIRNKVAEESEKWQRVDNTLRAIIMEEAETNARAGYQEAVKYDLATKLVTRQVVEENPSVLPKDADGNYKQPSWVRRWLRHGSSPEYIAMLAGGRDKALHNIAFKRIAAAQSLAYQKENLWRTAMQDFFRSRGKSDRDLIHWANERIRVRLDDGSTLTLTRPEAVTLYATAANADSRDLLKSNGIVTNKNRGTNDVRKISEEDLARISGQMTDFDVATAETMLSLFNGPIKDALNEASVMLEGFEKYRVPNYFPRTADKTGMDKDLTNIGEVFRGLMFEQAGYGKERVKHNNPLVIMDAMTLFDRHIKDASMYSDVAVPIRNAMRVIGNGEVKKAINERVGSDVTKSIEEHLFAATGMNNRAMNDDASAAYRKWLRMFSVGVLGYRPTTILNNLLGAPLQIWAEIPEQYRADFWKNWSTLAARPDQVRSLFQEMMAMDAYFEHRYTRDPGRIAVYAPESINETVGKSEAWIRFKKFQDHSMKWMQDAERLAAVAAYKAIRDKTTPAKAKSELSKRFRDPSEGIDAVKEYAAHEAMILTRRTQNAIDALDKSAFARRMQENPLAMSQFMFTSQLFKLRDMTLMAALDLKRGHISKAEFARKMAIIMASVSIVPTLASGMWREAREGFADKKESEEAKRMSLAAMAALNGIELISPMVGSIVRSGYAAASGSQMGGRGAGPLGESVARVARGIERSMNAKDADKRLDAFIDALGTAGQVGGVPKALFEVPMAMFKFTRPDDPTIPFYDAKYRVQEKLGRDEKTGRYRTIEEAARAGIRISAEDARALGRAESVIRKANELRKLADERDLGDDWLNERLKKLTRNPPE